MPDVVLIIENNRAGAISYEQLSVLWSSTVFLEDDRVPPDSKVVGHTWRYVNKNGGPDRRFNNNREIPQVLYQQMGVQGPGGLQKILHLSQVADRDGFDGALQKMRAFLTNLQKLSLPSPQ
jgi:hypothetical protein